MMRYRISIVFIIGLLTFGAKGQDSQFSMYDASELILNPAYAGTDHESKLRAVSQYRTQWSSVSSNFITSALAVDLPFKDRWGIGASLMHNDASNIMSETYVVFSGSYDVLKQDQDIHRLTTGLNLGMLNKNINDKELFFDSQYDNNGGFNTSLSSGEILGKTNRFMPEVSFGVAYMNMDKNKSYRPYGGISIFHLTRPDESFVNTTSKVPMRFVFNGGVKLFFQNEEIEVDPKFLIMRQTNAMNVILGLTGGYKVKSDVKLLGGATFRLGDAIIPQLGVEYLNFTYMMTYDINVSSLSEFSNNRGAFEFVVVYKGISRFGMGTTGVPHDQ